MVQSLESIAYNRVRERLMTGAIPSGAKLSETRLAQDIGISRTPIRHALRQLEADGLVVQVPRVGSFVNVPTRRDIEEGFELRQLLEGHAAAKAAQSASDKDITLIKRQADRMKAIYRHLCDAEESSHRNALLLQFVQADLGFHAEILRTAGNRHLQRVVSNAHLQQLTRAVTGMGREPWHVMRGRLVRTWREHHQIVCAIRQRQPELARTVTVRGLEQACRYTLERFDRQDEQGEGVAWPPTVKYLIEQSQRENEEQLQAAYRGQFDTTDRL